jgi:hypothetical protein
MAFFSFPEDAQWNPQTEAVEFSVTIGGYEGTVRTPARFYGDSLARRRRPRNVSRHIIYIARSSSGLSRPSSDAGNWPKTETSNSAAVICVA